MRRINTREIFGRIWINFFSPDTSINRDTTVDHVCVVDDNADIRFYLTDLLQQMGCKTEAYGSTSAFLQQSMSVTPAVLVMDICMPSVSGVDLQAKLKSLGRNIPIILIRGERQSEEINRAMKGLPSSFSGSLFRSSR